MQDSVPKMNVKIVTLTSNFVIVAQNSRRRFRVDWWLTEYGMNWNNKLQKKWKRLVYDARSEHESQSSAITQTNKKTKFRQYPLKRCNLVSTKSNAVSKRFFNRHEYDIVIVVTWNCINTLADNIKSVICVSVVFKFKWFCCCFVLYEKKTVHIFFCFLQIYHSTVKIHVRWFMKDETIASLDTFMA